MVRLHTLDLRLVIGRRLRNVSDLTSKPVESGCHDSLRMPKPVAKLIVSDLRT